MSHNLLSIVELGGYANFNNLYQQLGFNVEVENSMRKAIKTLKKTQPKVIVAEFNFQSDFRDRSSSLESLLAAVQWMPETQVVVFYDKEWIEKLDKLLEVHTVYETLPFPINERELSKVLMRTIEV